ncbi:MAG: divalent-cation tolerance protein CutA [Chloroflexota bacterium]
MKEPAYAVVLITTGTVDEAERISTELLSHKKAACVNIVPRVSSRFWWQGKIDSSQESLLIVKTKISLLDEVVELVKGIHSYQVPEVIALPIIGGNSDYLDWIESAVGEAKTR